MLGLRAVALGIPNAKRLCRFGGCMTQNTPSPEHTPYYRITDFVALWYKAARGAKYGARLCLIRCSAVILIIELVVQPAQMHPTLKYRKVYRKAVSPMCSPPDDIQP